MNADVHASGFRTELVMMLIPEVRKKGGEGSQQNGHFRAKLLAQAKPIHGWAFGEKKSFMTSRISLSGPDSYSNFRSISYLGLHQSSC